MCFPLFFLALFEMCYLSMSKKHWTLKQQLQDCLVELLNLHSSKIFKAAFSLNIFAWEAAHPQVLVLG